MQALSIASVATPQLSERERDELRSFLEGRWGAAGAGYFTSRLSRYRTLHTGRAGADFTCAMLTDSAARRGVAVHYVGPVFSARRSYLNLFVHWVTELTLASAPFCVVAEVETRRVERDMASLLPAWIYPRPAVTTPSELYALAQALPALFEHVHGVDRETLTSQVVEPLTPSPGRTRYQMLMLPCFGDFFAPERLRQELTDGLRITARARARRTTPVLCSGS
ncbi:MAG: hypothetical protein QM756_38940 [Polyangiaceae bacterium]